MGAMSGRWARCHQGAMNRAPTSQIRGYRCPAHQHLLYSPSCHCCSVGGDSVSVRAVIIMPTYNERGNLPQIVAAIWQHAPWANILVVDDNSPDGTGQAA